MSANGGIMLFGLGAPKAGTSWLHGYLAGHPEVFVPPLKEMHFFNAVDEGPQARLTKILEKRRAVVKRIAKHGAAEVSLSDLDDVKALIEDGTDAAYLDFMRSRSGGRKVMADITPAYGLLSLERLKAMQAMGESRFIYLMRDPVSRLWSHVRMNAVRKLRKTGKGDIQHECRSILDNVLSGKLPRLQARSDYASVLKKLLMLEPARVLIAFYEDLFTNKTVQRICDFLEIAMKPADFATRVNEGRATIPLAAADRARAAQYLKPQYAAVQAQMGRLPEAWKQNAGEA